MRIKTLAITAVLALTPAPLAAGDAASSGETPLDVWGYWYTPERDSLVRIADCGDGTPCGTVVWVDPVRGEVTHDVHNRDPELHGRPIEGITLLSGFEPAANGWRRGAIYHPGNGTTYRAKMRLTAPDTLRVAGCVGPICKGMDWPRGEERVARAAD